MTGWSGEVADAARKVAERAVQAGTDAVAAAKRHADTTAAHADTSAKTFAEASRANVPKVDPPGSSGNSAATPKKSLPGPWPRLDDFKQFGSWLQAARASRGMGVPELAAALGGRGMDTHIRSIERMGTATPDMVRRLTAGLGCPDHLRAAVLDKFYPRFPLASEHTTPNRWFRAARIGHELTQQDLADRANVSMSALQSKEKGAKDEIPWGERIMKPEFATKLLHGLGLDATDPIALEVMGQYFPDAGSAK